MENCLVYDLKYRYSLKTQQHSYSILLYNLD